MSDNPERDAVKDVAQKKAAEGNKTAGKIVKQINKEERKENKRKR